MIEFYSQIKLIHVTAALTSGSLFALRGLLLLLGQRWVLGGPLRQVTYVVDTVLLAAALMLMTIIRQYPFLDGWLTAKVLLLVVYIVLGYLAFWRARTPAMRLGLWLAGLLVFGFIVSVALAHDPRGIFAS